MRIKLFSLRLGVGFAFSSKEGGASKGEGDREKGVGPRKRGKGSFSTFPSLISNQVTKVTKHLKKGTKNHEMPGHIVSSDRLVLQEKPGGHGGRVHKEVGF